MIHCINYMFAASALLAHMGLETATTSDIYCPTPWRARFVSLPGLTYTWWTPWLRYVGA